MSGERIKQLRKAIMGAVAAGYEAFKPMSVRDFEDVDGLQIIDGVWYLPKFGCDSLDHAIDALLKQFDDALPPPEYDD